MTALPASVGPAGTSCLPERKFSLHFARFGAVCMHCVPNTGSGGSSGNNSSVSKSLPEPPNSFDKLRLRKPVSSSSNSKYKGYHRRSYSTNSQGMLSSRGCAALAAFENLSLGDNDDDSFPRSSSFKRLVSTEIPPTPILGPTVVGKEPPVFGDLDCDTVTPSSESISPPPLDL